jgi:hypothetical protein
LADAAFGRLAKKSELPLDVIRSVFFPRKFGASNALDCSCGYSAAAISVAHALALYEWGEAASRVQWAQIDLEEKGLSELRSILTGERQPEELHPPRLKGAQWDVDLVLWSDVNGLYFDNFLDAPIRRLIVRPASVRSKQVFEASGVIGHERVVVRSHDMKCSDFVARKTWLQSNSAKPLVERQTTEIVMRLAVDASPDGRDIVFFKGSTIGWVATVSEAADWESLLKNLRTPRSGKICLERPTGSSTTLLRLAR